MLHFETLKEAEIALGRELSHAEILWFKYTARMPDLLIHFHNFLFLLIVFSLVPLPLILLELKKSKTIGKFKLQPRVFLPSKEIIKCYKNVLKTFFMIVLPLQIASYPTLLGVGIRTGLPLPSGLEFFFQILAYFLIEDYLNYWIHRWIHCKWGYEKIHRIHHEYTAPMGFAAPYAHWAEVLLLGIPTFAGPALVPGHIITFTLWIILRQIEAIETHSGYDFPFNPTKYIPFYGGAEYHDYHHYVGGQSQSNFASVFTYCDRIYGTDKGYRYHKENVSKARKKEEQNNYSWSSLEDQKPKQL